MPTHSVPSPVLPDRIDFVVAEAARVLGVMAIDQELLRLAGRTGSVHPASPATEIPARSSKIAITLSWDKLCGSLGSFRQAVKRPVGGSKRFSPPPGSPPTASLPVLQKGKDQVATQAVGLLGSCR